MKYDVTIIGAGIAGLYVALNLPEDFNVLILSKSDISNCNTYRAQGGIACVWDDDDSFEYHIKDSLNAGHNKNDIRMLEFMVKEGPENIKQLINYGVDFDKNENDYDLTLEGGHTKRRILHSKDTTGKNVLEALHKTANSKPNIKIMENAMAINVVKKPNYFCTSIIDENDDELEIISKFVVIASGGIGKIYKYTTNASIATGDGIVLASRLGAELNSMDFIQFHPTGLYELSGDRFLISESVRGEGAKLRNPEKELFMNDYHNLADLAPRDIVSKAMLEQMTKFNVEFLFLDVTSKTKEYLEKRFPYIYNNCQSRNISMEKDMIPVSPCQHYLMGGIKINEFAKTNIEHLYAVGECACTNVHGNNRLASNSLLEALVFSSRAAEAIEKQYYLDFNNNIQDESKDKIHESLSSKSFNILSDEELVTYKDEIQSIMQGSFFVNFNLEFALENLDKLIKIKEVLMNYNNKNKNFYELVFLSDISNIIIKEKIHNARISNR